MLKHEHIRNQLISSLNILSDIQKQSEFWGKDQKYDVGDPDFDMIMHLFLDDYPLDNDPSSAIGWFLKDEIEAKLAAEVTLAILRVQDKVGRTGQPHQYITHPLWEKVVEAAQKASNLIK